MSQDTKYSGVKWIGQIPLSWKTIKLKYLITDSSAGEVIDKSYWNDGEDLLYTCQRVPMQSTFADFPKSKRTGGNDLLLTRNATPYVFIPEEGAIYSNVVQRIVLNAAYHRAYVRYSVQCGVESFVALGDTIPSYNMEIWKNVVIPDIPYDLQVRIATWLDSETEKLEQTIEKTRSSICSYRKLKQEIITQAVTKGLRKAQLLKQSEHEWIGAIPTHWDDAKLKYFVELRAGITLGKSYPADAELVEVPYLRVANVQGSYVDLSNVTTLSVLPEEIEKYRLHAGEVLMTEGGDRDKLGRGCVWNGELDPCLHQNHVFAVTTNEELLGQFLAYMTASSVARTYFDITAKKTTNLACTNSTTILNFTMPIPPSRSSVK